MRVAPGPRGHALFGSYRDLQRDPLGFFMRGSREYGDIFRFTPFPGARWHFINHPDYLDHVLQRQHHNYAKGIYGRLVSLAAGDGLIALEGDRWQRERRLVRPAFDASRLDAMANVMTRDTQTMLDAWAARADRPRRIDVVPELMRLTLGIAGRSLCGVDVDGNANAFSLAFRETLAYLDYRLVHPFMLPLPIPTPRNVRYRRAVRRLNAIMDPLIAARRREGGDRGDVLSALLHARDEEGAPIDDRQIREEMRTFLAAGHETTAAALFWSLYLIARHPEQERRLHAEIDTIGGVPTIADLARLPFTRTVVEESLRMYPAVVWLGRVPIRDDEIGGYRIEAGSHVLLSTYVLHRHPQFWDQPDAFDPDRFTPERAAARRRGAYLPFGVGPRRCIGDRMGMMEALLLLAMIGRRFRLRLERDEPLEPELLATLRPPSSVTMIVEPR